MKYVRLWFVALLAAALLREKAIAELEDDTYVHDDSWAMPAPPPEPFWPEMPEPTPWFSFIDQTTGTWKEEWK